MNLLYVLDCRLEGSCICRWYQVGVGVLEMRNFSVSGLVFLHFGRVRSVNRK
jgi:hypothetical protein